VLNAVFAKAEVKKKKELTLKKEIMKSRKESE
jgi:hypothetical protein